MLTRTNPTSIIKSCLLLLISLPLNPLIALGQDSGKVDFVTTIKPIFEQHCVSCHGKKDPEAFRIDLKDEAMDYIEVESAEDSNLYQVLVSDDDEELMPPPDHENPLTKTQIQSVKEWIDQGADWPADVKLVDTYKAAGSSTDTTPAVEGAANGEKAPAVPAPAISPKTKRMLNATGSLHPAAVHLPIGLLLAAGLFSLFSLRGNFVMSDCAYYCLWLGTLGAIVACVTGWWCSPLEGKGTVKVFEDLWDQTQPVFWHRSSAIVATVLALLLSLFAASARNRDPDDGLMWKLGAIILAAAIAWVGHEGGELTHGKHHYDDLKAIGAELLPSVFGEPEVEVEPEIKAEPKAVAPIPAPAKKEESEVGQTSDET